jgi:hypothetical protein
MKQLYSMAIKEIHGVITQEILYKQHCEKLKSFITLISRHANKQWLTNRALYEWVMYYVLLQRYNWLNG